MHDLTIHKNVINELQRVSNLDRLTNIASRRRFESVFEREDLYGHRAGDACLQEVARAIADADLAARYGGEEFVLVLADTDVDGAVTVAGNALRKIAELAIPHAQSDAAGHVTVSCGVATARPKEGGDPDSLVEAADEALYRSKAEGRNRITAANG